MAFVKIPAHRLAVIIRRRAEYSRETASLMTSIAQDLPQLSDLAGQDVVKSLKHAAELEARAASIEEDPDKLFLVESHALDESDLPFVIE